MARDLGLADDSDTFTEWEMEEIKNGVACDMMVGNLWFLPLQTSLAGVQGGTEDTQEGYRGGVCGLPCRGDG